MSIGKFMGKPIETDFTGRLRLEVKRTDMGQLSQGWTAGMWRQEAARKRLI
jgi:hypothetical protein